jgi:hypothetical protein
MLLADPEETKRKLEQFTSARDQAQALIDLAGPANEIVYLRSKLAIDQQKMQDLLTDAQSRADVICRDAHEKAAQIIVEATQDAESIRGEAAALKNAAQALQTAADALRAKALSEHEERQVLIQDANVIKKALLESQQVLNDKQDELDQRLGQLENARASLKLLLG